MNKATAALRELTGSNQYGTQSSFMHKLDPRCKIIATFVFIVSVVSSSKYTLLPLIPFFSFPLFIIIISEIPLLPLFRKLAVMSLFAIFVGAANPFLDREPLYTINNIHVSGGWVSFFSIIIKFILTGGAALLLLMTTGLYDLCLGLEKLRIPQIFVNQLLFLCRYLSLATEEGARLSTARNVRSFGRKGKGIKSYSSIISVLLMRSIDRAERIYAAMKCRGFSGSINRINPLKWHLKETLFLLIWSTVFILLRFYFSLHN